MSGKIYISLAFAIVALAICSDARGKVPLTGKLYARLDSFFACATNPEENFSVLNMSMTKYGVHDFFIDAKFAIHRTLKIKKTLVKINRCPNTVASSCELLQTWTFGRESCSVMLQRDMPWAGIYHRMRPCMECPIKRNEYTVENGTLLIEAIKHLPMRLENNYWRIFVEAFEEKGLFMCFGLSGTVIRARS